MDVICFYPRVLKSVEINHNFLLKKKLFASPNTSFENCQLTSSVASSDQQLYSSSSQKTLKHLYSMNKKKNLPSNHTICEVSERDSENDERSRTLKRVEAKQATKAKASNTNTNQNSNPKSKGSMMRGNSKEKL